MRRFVCLAVLMLVALWSASAIAESEYGSFPGVTLNFGILSGDHPVAWSTVIPEFEAMTGCKVQILDLSWDDLFSKTYLDLVSRAGTYDLIELAGFWVPDYAANGLIAPLDSYFSTWDWGIDGLMPVYQNMGMYAGHRYGVLWDGDVFALYYRKDLFESPTYQTEFKLLYGRDLTVPATWDEYLQVAAYFNNRDTDGDGRVDLYGNEAMLNRGNGPIMFMQLLRSFGGQFFDPNTMEPLIGSAAGRKALETMVEISKYMPMGAASHDFTITRDNFTNGNAAMVVQWTDVGSWSQTADGSKVKGKVGFAPVPAGVLNGLMYSASELAWNWQGVIPAGSLHKDAAAQLIRYMTSPEVSTRVVALARGYDPYRQSMFSGTALVQGWFPGSADLLSTLEASMNQGVYDLYIPGAQQYLDSVGKYLGDLVTGTRTVDQVVASIAAEWNDITNRWDRQSQLEAYQEYMRTYWGWQG